MIDAEHDERNCDRIPAGKCESIRYSVFARHHPSQAPQSKRFEDPRAK